MYYYFKYGSQLLQYFALQVVGKVQPVNWLNIKLGMYSGVMHDHVHCISSNWSDTVGKKARVTSLVSPFFAQESKNSVNEIPLRFRRPLLFALCSFV